MGQILLKYSLEACQGLAGVVYAEDGDGFERIAAVAVDDVGQVPGKLSM